MCVCVNVCACMRVCVCASISIFPVKFMTPRWGYYDNDVRRLIFIRLFVQVIVIVQLFPFLRQFYFFRQFLFLEKQKLCENADTAKLNSQGTIWWKMKTWGQNTMSKSMIHAVLKKLIMKSNTIQSYTFWNKYQACFTRTYKDLFLDKYTFVPLFVLFIPINVPTLPEAKIRRTLPCMHLHCINIDADVW